MLAFLLAAAIAAQPGSPQPQSTAEEAQLVAAAKTHFKQRQYSLAIAKFQAAYELGKNTVRLHNIGKCYERLNETGKALRYFREYLRLEPTARQDDLLKGDIANAERRLKEQGLQQIAVFADPPGAEVRVDQVRQASMPVYLELTAGEHVFVVKAEGYETEERRLKVPLPGGSAEASFNLRPLKAPADAPRAARDVPPVPATSTAPKTVVARGATVERPPADLTIAGGAGRTGSKAPGWIACGTAVVAVGLGAFALAEGFSAKGKYDQGATLLRSSPVQTNTGIANYNQLVSDGNSANTAAWIGAGGAAAAVLATGILGYLSYRQVGEIGPFRF
jgi:hypothetical protein